MLRKRLALLLVSAMMVTTISPAVYADEVVVSDAPAITSEETISNEDITQDKVNNETVEQANNVAESDLEILKDQKTEENKDATQEATMLKEAETAKMMVLEEQASTAEINETKNSVMYKHLLKLSENARTAGSQAEYDARDYIENVFKGLGYDTSVKNFHWERIKNEVVVKQGDSSNVIAVKEGTSGKQIIIGAHYDSVNASTGASDNASGVSVMLGAAEALKDVKSEYTFKFVAFGAEEVGLKGSRDFAYNMSKDEINNTVAMINLDTVLMGDKMYAYGNLGRDSWLCNQALSIAKELDLDVITQEGLAAAYPAGTTGDWSDHAPFKELGLPWVYFESTNWDLLYDDGSYSEGDSETKKFGEIMHTERDNISFMDKNYPGRMENRLYTYTTLLVQLLKDINPSLAEDSIVVSTDKISLSQERIVDISIEFGEAPDLSSLEWTFGGKPFSEWKQSVITGRDGKSQMTPTEDSFITFEQQPKLVGNKVIAKVKFGLPFGTDNLSLRPFPRRVYPDLLGEYELKVKDTNTNKSVSKTMTYNAFDSFHKQVDVKPAIEEIISTARDDRYVEYAPLGKSAEGRDIPFVILSRNKDDVNKYLNETLPMMLENPTQLIQKIQSDGADGYKPVIWFNNIHSDEANGVDAQIDLLRKLTRANEITFNSASNLVKGDKNYGNYEDGTPNEVTLDVQKLLDNFIVVFSLNNNPDGRFYNNRETVSGFDPNRDVTYQTQIETATVFQALSKWSPMIFNDFHGFVSDFLIEPCTPPHEPNFEYDLIMDGAYEHAKALGKSGIANTKYDHFIIPYDDYGDGWDDGAPMYAAVLSLLHGAIGHTVEIPELNQQSNDAFMYAGLGSLNYALENKERLFKNQLMIYERGINGIDAKKVDKWLINANGEVIGRPRGDNANFFPEYYVLPVDSKLQKNSLAAYEMAEFLINNGVKVDRTTTSVTIGNQTYPEGSFIVNMHQAKRGFANTVLYDGSDFSDFKAMYAEVTMCFPMLRGFDKYEIRQSGAFDGKTQKVKEVVIPATNVPSNGNMIIIRNTNNDAIKAVNSLLDMGKKVYFTYGEGNNFKKGDFVVAKSDIDTIKDKYFLNTAALDGKASVKELNKINVAGQGNELNYVLKDLGFTLTKDFKSADIIVDEEGAAALQEVKAVIEGGTPIIAIGGYGMSGISNSGLLPGFEVGGFEDYYEGVLRADINTDSVVTANYDKEDILYNNTDTWIQSAPSTAKILATISSKDNFYVAGWWPNHEEVKGKPFIIQDKIGDTKITVFANHLVNKAHPSHQFRLLANAIYDSQKGELIEVTGKVTSGGGGSHHGGSGGSNNAKPQDTIKQEDKNKPDETTNNANSANFTDVKGSSWFAPAVTYVMEKGIMKGLDSKNFGPNVKTNRAMIVTMLHRLEGEPKVQSAGYIDVKSGQWYESAVSWANSNGIVTGFENKTFNPNGDLSREQLATVLYRYAKYKKIDTVVKGDLNKFNDSGQVSSYAQDAISWAVGAGILNGKDGKLDPKGSATRAELATMFQRMDSILN
ncbi:MAG: M28 family peptidase [Aminipila sp.]